MEDKDFWDAVDIVCMDCHYLSEETCEGCPVRKTCDEKTKEENMSFIL